MLPTNLITDLWYNLINPGLSLFGDFISSCWPWAAVLLGLGTVGLIARLLIEKIEEIWEWNDEKAYLNDVKITYQELMGSGKGAMAFERWRIANMLSSKPIDAYSFITPRDMPAGLSENSYLREPAGIGPDWMPTFGQQRISLTEKEEKKGMLDKLKKFYHSFDKKISHDV